MRVKCWAARPDAGPILALVLCLLCVSPAVTASAQVERSYPFCLVICDGLTADSLDSPLLPSLRRMAELGSVGLMNTAVEGPKTEAAALLTMSLGYRVPALVSDLDGYLPGQSVGGERTTAAAVFRRRTGREIGASDTDALLHLGIGSLTRRALNEDLVGSRLAAGNATLRLWVGPLTAEPPLGAALFVTDSTGIGHVAPYPGYENAKLPTSVASACDVEAARISDTLSGGKSASLVVHIRSDALGAGLRGVSGSSRNTTLSQVFLDALLHRLMARPVSVLVVSPRPSADDRLSLVVSYAPTKDYPGLLSSATTRTSGLVANIDVAPTILAGAGVVASPRTTGHPMTRLAAPDAIARIHRLDRIVTVNAYALGPVFWLLGIVALVVVASGLWAVSMRPAAGPRCGIALLCLMNMPLAMLLVGPLGLPTVPALAAALVALMAILGGSEWLVSRRFGWSAPATAAAATVIAILADSALGQSGVRFSLLSSYQLQGIRFYGIGNEYMGVLIGCALLAVCSLRPRPWHAALVFAVVTLVLGHPSLGAKGGGPIVASVAFGTAWMALRGGRPGWRAAALWACAGIGLSLAAAWIERATAGPASSHLGASLAGAEALGWGYLGDIVSRKLSMNLRIAANPITLTAAVAVCVILVAVYRTAGGRLGRMVEAHPGWALGLRPAGFAALAAFLFNDSGVVASLFILGVYLASGLVHLFGTAAAKDPERTTDPAR